MARSIFNVKYNCDFNQAQNRVAQVLCNKGFSETTIKTGEKVWKKGTGALTAMQFIKIEYAQGEFIIHAWVQAGVGSVGGNEMDLTGFVCAFPKGQLMKVVEEIKRSF